jgi:hypothetical protein
MHMRGDFIERRWLHSPDGCEQGALLTLGLCRGDVAAELLDQFGEAVGERRWC